MAKKDPFNNIKIDDNSDPFSYLRDEDIFYEEPGKNSSEELVENTNLEQSAEHIEELDTELSKGEITESAKILEKSQPEHIKKKKLSQMTEIEKIQHYQMLADQAVDRLEKQKDKAKKEIRDNFDKILNKIDYTRYEEMAAFLKNITFDDLLDMKNQLSKDNYDGRY